MPPRRAVQVHLNLQADTWQGAVDAVSNLVFVLARQEPRPSEPRRIISGGVSVSYVLEASVDPTVTAASYRAALTAWLEARG